MYVPSYTYNEPSSSYTSQPAPQKIMPTKSSDDKPAISTAAQVRHASQALTSTSTKVTEAIHLVGDKKSVPQPLIKLLGKALAAHLIYPKIAIDFKLHGTAFVAFILHPDGTLTNVQLVQSSLAGVLDDEAVMAVSAISPLKNVNPYVAQARPMVVGIIFN
jgi:TonB family protein